MKKVRNIGVVIALVITTLSCGQVASLVRSTPTNVFERRVPILYCDDNLEVYDPQFYDLGDYDIDPSKPIWLLTPQVTLNSSYINSFEDQKYLDRKEEVLRGFIEHKFLNQFWVKGLLDLSLPELTDSTGLNAFIAPMHQAVKQNESIDTKNWKVDARFHSDEIQGYNLLIVIDGQVGYEKESDNLNELSWFIIDNLDGKVKYADHFHYGCDVRNYDGLDRVTSYASGKLSQMYQKESVQQGIE